MTDAALPSPPPPAFGVGGVLSRSLRVFARRLIPIMIVSYPTLLLSYLIIDLGADTVIAGLIEFAVLTVFGAFASVYVILLIASAERGGRPDIAGSVGAAVFMAPTVSLISLLATMLLALGFLALIIPGVFLAAALFPLYPALALERDGLGSFSRAMDLTRGYRWPILGLLICLALLLFLAALILIVPFIVAFGADAVEWTALSAALDAVIYGFSATASTLAYFRLREIKEGLGAENIAEVFS